MKKSLYPLILLSLLPLCWSCRNSTTGIQEEYILDYTSSTDYEYSYNSKGLPEKVIERSDNIAYLNNDFIVSEKWYFYDERDSLCRVEQYDSLHKPELKEITYYSDSTEIKINIQDGITDTTTIIKFLPGFKDRPYEEYRKFKGIEGIPDSDYFPGIEGIPAMEEKIFRTYDKAGRTIRFHEIDLLANREIIRDFRYETINDTLFQYSYANNELEGVYKSYSYTTPQHHIEVSYNIEKTFLDSTFICDKEKRIVTFIDNLKDEQIYLFDEKKNIIREIHNSYYKKGTTSPWNY